jgi:hypothetical protein
MNKFSIYFCLVLLLLCEVVLSQPAKVRIRQDAGIDSLILLKKTLNKELKNFKIQIYSGPRIAVEEKAELFSNSFEKVPLEVVYETPNYKLWAGDFRTRLEADYWLIEIKKVFPSAFIFKPKTAVIIQRKKDD